jgi:hypothetical protein
VTAGLFLSPVGVPKQSWRCQMGCRACWRYVGFPPDHRVRLGQIGGVAQHKGFDLIKCVLMVSEFDNLCLTVVDLS